MPEKTKPKEDAEKKSAEKPEIGDESSWRKEQEEKSYYYDDACGYEIYNPDEDDEAEN